MPPRRRNANPPTNTIPAEPIATQGGTGNVEEIIHPEEVEDFGRDKDLKALLKTLQPKAFTGEGSDVPKMLEEWILSMDDYFTLAGYNPIAQGIMGRAKLDGPAKLWWKLSCQSRSMTETSQGWEELKMRLRERYLPLNYTTNKMNEFLSCVRKGRSVEVYYEEFVKLSRHAPLMTEDQKLSRFVLGLEGKLADEVESLRPVSLADALIRANSKLNSFLRGATSIERKRDVPPYFPAPNRVSKAPYPIQPMVKPPPIPCLAPTIQPVQLKALPITQSGKPLQCHGCQGWGHKRADCPSNRKPSRPPLPSQKEVFENRSRYHAQNSNQAQQRNQNQNRNQARPLPQNPPQATTINHVSIKEEMEEQAQIYATLDPSGYNQQFSIQETQGDYEGGLSDETRADMGYEGEASAP